VWICARDFHERKAHSTWWAATTIRRRASSRFRSLRHGNPEAPVRLHRIRNDQHYHYYLGDPIEVLMLHADGTTERVVVGPDLRGGQRVQLLIPGNTFHTARVIPEGFRGCFLGESTEWPGVETAAVEIGNVEALTKEYPDAAEDLRAFQQGGGD
jgi:predicted cupin superfamily sugar epimerase